MSCLQLVQIQYKCCIVVWIELHKLKTDILYLMMNGTNQISNRDLSDCSKFSTFNLVLWWIFFVMYIYCVKPLDGSIYLEVWCLFPFFTDHFTQQHNGHTEFLQVDLRPCIWFPVHVPYKVLLNHKVFKIVYCLLLWIHLSMLKCSFFPWSPSLP